jgi:aerotaxis receptor
MRRKSPQVRDEEYHLNDGVIISETDTSGVITYVNKKFCQITGYDKDELIGKKYKIIRHPDMPKKIFEELWDTIETGKHWDGLIKNLRKDGRYYWVYTHIEPVENDGKITGYLAIHRPASESEIKDAKIKYLQLKNKERK